MKLKTWSEINDVPMLMVVQVSIRIFQAVEEFRPFDDIKITSFIKRPLNLSLDVIEIHNDVLNGIELYL